MEDELSAYRIKRIRFRLSEYGMPYDTGFECVFVTPEERSAKELDRVADVMQFALDKSEANLYSSEDDGD